MWRTYSVLLAIASGSRGENLESGPVSSVKQGHEECLRLCKIKCSSDPWGPSMCSPDVMSPASCDAHLEIRQKIGRMTTLARLAFPSPVPDDEGMFPADSSCEKMFQNHSFTLGILNERGRVYTTRRGACMSSTPVACRSICNRDCELHCKYLKDMSEELYAYDFGDNFKCRLKSKHDMMCNCLYNNSGMIRNCILHASYRCSTCASMFFTDICNKLQAHSDNGTEHRKTPLMREDSSNTISEANALGRDALETATTAPIASAPEFPGTAGEQTFIESRNEATTEKNVPGNVPMEAVVAPEATTVANVLENALMEAVVDPEATMERNVLENAAMEAVVAPQATTVTNVVERIPSVGTLTASTASFENDIEANNTTPPITSSTSIPRITASTSISTSASTPTSASSTSIPTIISTPTRASSTSIPTTISSTSIPRSTLSTSISTSKSSTSIPTTTSILTSASISTSTSTLTSASMSAFNTSIPATTASTSISTSASTPTRASSTSIPTSASTPTRGSNTSIPTTTSISTSTSIPTNTSRTIPVGTIDRKDALNDGLHSCTLNAAFNLTPSACKLPDGSVPDIYQPDAAYRFTNQSINLSDQLPRVRNTHGAYSIEFVVKSKELVRWLRYDGVAEIFAHGNGSTIYRLYTGARSDEEFIEVRTEGKSGNGWHHFVYVSIWNSTSVEMRVYVDGQLAVSAVHHVILICSVADTRLSHDCSRPGVVGVAEGSGELRKYIVFKRALAITEIEELYRRTGWTVVVKQLISVLFANATACNVSKREGDKLHEIISSMLNASYILKEDVNVTSMTCGSPLRRTLLGIDGVKLLIRYTISVQERHSDSVLAQLKNKSYQEKLQDSMTKKWSSNMNFRGFEFHDPVVDTSKRSFPSFRNGGSCPAWSLCEAAHPCTCVEWRDCDTKAKYCDSTPGRKLHNLTSDMLLQQGEVSGANTHCLHGVLRRADDSITSLNPLAPWKKLARCSPKHMCNPRGTDPSAGLTANNMCIPAEARVAHEQLATPSSYICLAEGITKACKEGDTCDETAETLICARREAQWFLWIAVALGVLTFSTYGIWFFFYASRRTQPHFPHYLERALANGEDVLLRPPPTVVSNMPAPHCSDACMLSYSMEPSFLDIGCSKTIDGPSLARSFSDIGCSKTIDGHCLARSFSDIGRSKTIDGHCLARSFSDIECSKAIDGHCLARSFSDTECTTMDDIPRNSGGTDTWYQKTMALRFPTLSRELTNFFSMISFAPSGVEMAEKADSDCSQPRKQSVTTRAATSEASFGNARHQGMCNLPFLRTTSAGLTVDLEISHSSEFVEEPSSSFQQGHHSWNCMVPRQKSEV